jgi:hypothetical protein
MLIRSEQVTEFRSAQSQAFERRLISFLRLNLPIGTKEMTDHQISERISFCKHHGKSYDIDSESGIAMFVCLTFLPGTRFYEIPAVDKFLRRPTPSGNQKLIHLTQSVLRKLTTA